MKIKRLIECPEFIAGDKTRLRELWNPRNHPGFSGRYSLAHATVPAGETSTPHSLRSHELYYILSGEGLMHVDDDTEPVKPGDAVEIPPGGRQWIENTGSKPLEFLCIVDPAWRQEDEQVED